MPGAEGADTGVVQSSPNWLTAVNALPMYLGLDLRGGVHFLLQVDMLAAITKRLDAFGGDIFPGYRFIERRSKASRC